MLWELPFIVHLLCASLSAQNTFFKSFNQLCEASTFIISILQMKKLKLRKILFQKTQPQNGGAGILI